MSRSTEVLQEIEELKSEVSKLKDQVAVLFSLQAEKKNTPFNDAVTAIMTNNLRVILEHNMIVFKNGNHEVAIYREIHGEINSLSSDGRVVLSNDHEIRTSVTKMIEDHYTHRLVPSSEIQDVKKRIISEQLTSRK